MMVTPGRFNKLQLETQMNSASPNYKIPTARDK